MLWGSGCVVCVACLFEQTNRPGKGKGNVVMLYNVRWGSPT